MDKFKVGDIVMSTSMNSIDLLPSDVYKVIEVTDGGMYYYTITNLTNPQDGLSIWTKTYMENSYILAIPFIREKKLKELGI